MSPKALSPVSTMGTVGRVVLYLVLSGGVVGGGSSDAPGRTDGVTLSGQGTAKLSGEVGPERLPLTAQAGNATMWQAGLGSKMAWLTGLFDHHEWDRHLGNVTEPCAGELRSYVTALNAGQLWASKMYDSSGHYNPNLMFGNEYWLGSLHACRELALRQYNAEVPPYRVAYHVARFNLSIADGHVPQSKWILLGTCLPAACEAPDVMRLLNSSAAAHAQRDSHVLVQLVRPVPGAYVVTQDFKFLVLASVTGVVCALMLAASLYEGWLERCERRRRQLLAGAASAPRHNNNNNVELGGAHAHANNNTEESACQRANGVKPAPPCDAPSAATPATPAATTLADSREERTAESRRPTTGFLSETLLSFSVLSNGRKMLSTERAADGALTCLHGMRFLSVIWVIMVHTYLTLFYISDNKTLRTVTERNFLYQSVGNASYSVDTFFFISGLLVTILFLRTEDKKLAKRIPTTEKTKNGFVNPALSGSTVTVAAHDHIDQDIIEEADPKSSHFSMNDFLRTAKKFFLMIFYRLIRLTPAYAFVIGVNEIALRYSHNNSVFEPAIFDHITCDLYWWRNLLYINNLFPQREMCMVWSWYMANDTQFYVVGLILLLISLRSMKVSVVSMAVLMMSSWVTTISISLSYQYKARIQDPFEMFDPLYDKPWARLGPYLVGMVVGWLLHRTRCQIRLPLWSVLLGWPVSIAIMGLLIFGMVDGYFEVWPTAFYVSIGHTAWGAALAWVTVACCCGYGGLVNSVLSYRGALPLSRLTYCAYLVHPTIMMYTSFLMDGPIHLQNSMVLVTYAGYAVCSFVASLGISLAFEAPIIRLMKIGISGPGSRGD